MSYISRSETYSKAMKKDISTSIVIIVGLLLVFVPYSLWIGWNAISVLLFWFVLIPIISIYLPRVIFGRPTLLGKLGGLVLFYALMVFMIYDHYQSDYFLVMMISVVINVLMILVFHIRMKPMGIGTKGA